MNPRDTLLDLLQSQPSIHINVKVTPRSPKTEWNGALSDGTYKVRLKAVPEHGQANAELIAFLARELDIPPANIALTAGHTSPRKRLRLTAP